MDILLLLLQLHFTTRPLYFLEKNTTTDCAFAGQTDSRPGSGTPEPGRHLIGDLWVMDRSYKHGNRAGGNVEYKGPIQVKVHNFIRGQCCAGTVFQTAR